MMSIEQAKLLVVDDNADVREALELFLTSEGYQVTTAATGREALEQMRSGVKVGLILLDLMMPDMTGFEFRLEQLRNPEFATVPLIAHSGIDDAETYAQRLNVDGFLRKPAKMDQVLDAVRAHWHA